jgi:hypothetical protein
MALQTLGKTSNTWLHAQSDTVYSKEIISVTVSSPIRHFALIFDYLLYTSFPYLLCDPYWYMLPYLVSFSFHVSFCQVPYSILSLLLPSAIYCTWSFYLTVSFSVYPFCQVPYSTFGFLLYPFAKYRIAHLVFQCILLPSTI